MYIVLPLWANPLITPNPLKWTGFQNFTVINTGVTRTLRWLLCHFSSPHFQAILIIMIFSKWKVFCVAFEAHTVVLLIRNVHIFCCLCNPALLWELCMYWLSEEMFHYLGFEIASSKFAVFLFSNINSFAISWLYVYHKTLARFPIWHVSGPQSQIFSD